MNKKDSVYKKRVKVGQGLRQLEKEAKKAIHREQSVEDWLGKFKEAAASIFKGATDVCITKYCPHLDKLITLKTNPYSCECEECIKDMENGNEADDSN
jgi:Zn finger protein HypA/HybF involved in hydrogenase expression